MKTNRELLFSLLAAAALLPPSFLHAQEEISPSALQQIEALMAEKETRTPAEQKLDSQLVYLSAQQQGQPVANGAPSLIPSVELTEGNLVLVDISGGVSKGLLDAITEAGGAVVNQFAPFDAIRAKVPVGALENLAGRADVRSISPAAQAITNMGTVVSEADRTHRASTARANLGVTGNGVKIGVLSDGVNSLGISINNGNINANAVVIPGQAGSGDEGTAMMELIQDLAPGAQLYFATAFNGNASFASNILALQAAGCTIIVDDVGYFNESPFQDQVISQAVKTVSDAGVLYFSSAGNSGNKNDGTSGTWEGDFVSGGAVAAPVTGTGTLLDFGGATTFNTVTAGGSSRRVDLFWSDPDLASANDYDLFVLDSTGASVLRSSTNLQTGTQSPYEAVSTLNIGERIVVVKRAGAADRFLQLTTGRARLTISTSGVVRGHNASGAANAFCVAATNVANSPSPSVFVGGGTNPVETFSSDGPRRIFFQANGTPLTAGNFSSTGGQVLSKPDITAADGTVTTVTGFTTFFGTSAAAPHAAAIAALLKSYKPSLTPAQIRTAMTSTALDIETAGVDRDSGAGIVMAEPALASVVAPDAMTVSSSGDLNASGPAGGPFVPTSVSYTVTNTSGAPLNWAAFKTRPWVSISPNGGLLAPAASAVVTCSINAGAAAALPVGAYSDVVTLTNLTSAYSRKLDVNLVVTTTIPAITSAAAYDNTTTYSGSVFFNNLATSTAVGTRMVVDDITFTPGSEGKNVTNFVWAIGNNDTVSFTARPIVRFWAPDGPGGGPGTLIAGYTFNPLTLAVGGSAWNFSPPAGELVIPAGNKIWAGLAFDGVGATATVANLNNLFQYIYSPPTVGSSADTMFLCTNLGANTVSNPAGSTSNFGGAPAANFYWRFSVSNTPPTVTTAEPAQVLSTSARLGGIVLSGGGEGVSERGIVWGAAVNPTTANNKSIIGSGTGAYSAVVTGLPATSTIHIRAYAITGVGTAYGPDITLVMPGSNSSLSSLVLTTATLSPVFASGTFSYTAGVPNSTSVLTVTPTAADATAAITVNGVSVASGGTSGSIPLAVGLNTITTVCTAPDSSSTRTYTVDVTRAAPGAEIAVFTGGNTLPGNERTDNTGTHGFGSVNTGSSSAAQTFTIQNTGAVNLTLGTVTLGGADPTQFSVTQPVSTTLATNATTTFTVTFSPMTAGSKSAVVNIASDDGDENPFRINVSGAGSIPSATPVGWWKFDEGSGTTALDSGALPANDGVMTAVSYVTDRVVGSHAATFSPGSTSRVEVANEASLNPTTGLSLTAWFKATSWPGNNRIIQKGGFGDDQYRITAEGGVFRCDLRTATSSTVRVDLPLPSTGVWHHVALTYDAAAGMRVYLDGVLAGSNLGAFGPVNVTTNALAIGTKPAGVPSDTFNGLLDDVRLYNVPLSAADVTGFYPEIAVYDGNGTGGAQRTDNTGTHNFGSMDTGSSSAAQTFTIQNAGMAELTGIAVTSTNSSEFTVSTSGMSTLLAPGATTTFTVTFNPAVVGGRSGVINIASNDADENPFEINVGGTGVCVPTYTESSIPLSFTDISASGTPVGLSDDSVSGAISLPFSFNFYGVARNSLYISSNGFVSFATPPDSGCCSGRLMPTTGFAAPLIAGSWNDLYPPGGGQIRYATQGAVGSRVFIVMYKDLPNFSGSSSDYTFAIKLFEATHTIEVHVVKSLGDSSTTSIGLQNDGGTSGITSAFGNISVTNVAYRYTPSCEVTSAPEIVVEQPAGTDLTDGAATIAFGTADVGVPVTNTFRVKNTGSGPLNITGITFDGSTPGDFSVTTAPASPVAASIGQTDFVVTFTPLQSGTRTAVMHIASDDADENPFDITLTGNGTTFTGGSWAGTPALITIPPNGSFVATGLNFDTDLGFVPAPNQSYTFINIQGVPPAGIIGNFNDLPDGGVVAMAFNGVIYYFQVDYTAGTDGNDL
ncbi:choice-of-anchor D domain-containing protein, partial [Brevifollis gellanilyticus]|uniref:choice-of-anchor D domain-containing protein n=1 Tax=Brevifollis gellanilyticus TaxID=748831 RepID=UPI0011BE5D4B